MSRTAGGGGPTRPPRRSGGASRARGAAAGTAPARGRPRAADPARTVAYETLRAVDERDAYANLVLPALLRRARLSPRDAALATELAYGTLRGRGTYDAVIAACVDRPLAELDPGVLDALRLGAHQLLATRVPPHAAVSTTVDLVRATSGAGASRFANAVLRRLAERDLPAWLADVAPPLHGPDADADAHLAVTTSHPAWMVRALRDALRVGGRSADELPALLAAQNERPRVAVAALPGLATPAELAAAGAEPGLLSPLAALLTGAPDDVAAIGEGRARVQDEGSQAVTLALAAAELGGPGGDAGDAGAWLDLCAGPGGKAALLAATLAARGGGTGGLVAVEVAEHRAELVRQALRPVPGAHEVRTADGRDAAEPGRYDRVLVDAPCTGLGALRRRPEARWRRSPQDLATLGPLQRDLLRAALDAARPGGVVAYVTCSPHPAETSAVVADVVRRREDVAQVDAREALVAAVGEGRAHDLGDGPAVQLWPHVHGTDAMYLALLRRTG
jgi:16S rRNA (cytosine967-C5)-methyltransferase